VVLMVMRQPEARAMARDLGATMAISAAPSAACMIFSQLESKAGHVCS
jgi:hypothetical protein